MGSGFIAYAIISTIILLVGEQWVRRSGRSLELWDSWCVLFYVQLLQSLIILHNKGNHHLGMPIWFTQFSFAQAHESTFPSYLRESVRRPFSFLNL